MKYKVIIREFMTTDNAEDFTNEVIQSYNSEGSTVLGVRTRAEYVPEIKGVRTGIRYLVTLEITYKEAE